MSISKCCLTGFKWDGNPTGRISKIGDIDTYVAGDNPDAAVLLVHDLFGWQFPNLRLLADHYASEANVTVYLPDFFKGESLPTDLLVQGRYGEVDIHGFLVGNGREAREELIFATARELRQKHTNLGAVGFCYGGWAVFRLGAKEHQPPLVDFITCAHPSLLTKEDVEGISVPVQVLAPEIDMMFTRDFKTHFFETLLDKASLPFEYVHFPGVEHAGLVRGNEGVKGEREAMTKGKNAVVQWIGQFTT